MMRIAVRVKPNSKKEDVERTGDGEFLVSVRARAKEGKANEAVIEALSEYFSVAKSRIGIVKGRAGKNKIIDIR